ncbi:MAG: suppressor of fused domain protein [Candidatus Obscuribacterales bacterium]|nr:suppressor of fused domain protein [Candidatus Obscuribacterales bacterium]
MNEAAAIALNRAWSARNELYLELFGSHTASWPSRYSSPNPPEFGSPEANHLNLASTLGRNISEDDIAILIYAPHEKSRDWTYVTSGLSNPWFGQLDNEVSGFGCELVIKSKERAHWPIRLLKRLAYYILSYSGTLSPGVMLELDTPLFRTKKSSLAGVLVWYVDEAPDCLYQLPSGPFGIFSIIGITEAENEFVRTTEKYGCWCMQEILRRCGFGQTTLPTRENLINNEKTNDIVAACCAYAENFAALENG